jgi:hypothetical protein
MIFTALVRQRRGSQVSFPPDGLGWLGNIHLDEGFAGRLEVMRTLKKSSRGKAATQTRKTPARSSERLPTSVVYTHWPPRRRLIDSITSPGPSPTRRLLSKKSEGRNYKSSFSTPAPAETPHLASYESYSKHVWVGEEETTKGTLLRLHVDQFRYTLPSQRFSGKIHRCHRWAPRSICG